MKYQINGTKLKKHVAIHSIVSDIKENFIKDFKFIPKEEHLRETTQQIKSFLENLTPSIQKEKWMMTVDVGWTSTCNLISTENNGNTTT
jgi:hypothetical protein